MKGERERKKRKKKKTERSSLDRLKSIVQYADLDSDRYICVWALHDDHVLYICFGLFTYTRE